MKHDDHSPRILGGSLRGRRLNVAPGKITRPLKVMARRSLFDSIQQLLPESRVLDVFAGAGTIGFEAASRGAARVVLVEAGAPAIRALRTSIDSLGVGGVVELAAVDAVGFVQTAEPHSFDFIFAGPPYPFFRGEARPRLLELFAGLPRLLKDGGLLVIEAPNAESPPQLDLPLLRSREYGESTLHHYQG